MILKAMIALLDNFPKFWSPAQFSALRQVGFVLKCSKMFVISGLEHFRTKMGVRKNGAVDLFFLGDIRRQDTSLKTYENRNQYNYIPAPIFRIFRKCCSKLF